MRCFIPPLSHNLVPMRRHKEEYSVIIRNKKITLETANDFLGRYLNSPVILEKEDIHGKIQVETEALLSS